MKKLEYFIKDIHPVDFFDKKNYDVIKIIKNNFPKVKIIAKGDRIVANGDDSLVIQNTNDDLLPFLLTIPLQKLAYYSALKKGYDIDKPRNLAKSVTVE